MRCVRVFFTKLGESKYISHLDLMRAMSRAVRRARLPLWYTEGYNPHPYMTFALPLSLGAESLCESMDIRLEGDITDSEVLTRLREVMPSGIDIIRVCEPVFDPKKIAYGRFEIVFHGAQNLDGFSSEVKALIEAGGLSSEKLSKKGRFKVMKEISLSEHINEYSVSVRDDAVVLEIVLPAGSVTNINPSLVADAILKRTQFNGISATVLRKELLTESMESFV